MGANKKIMSVEHAFLLFRLKENRQVVKIIYRFIYISPFKGTPWDETFSMLSILKI